MRLLATALATASLTLFVWSTVSAAQAAKGVVRGQVTDASGGLLPGVTVVAIAPSGQVLSTTVSDRAGAFVVRDLPTGPVMLRFQLEGFAGVLVGVTIEPGVDAHVAQSLELAPLSETVDVRAPAPVEPPRPPAPRPVPSTPPAPRLKPVPTHDRDSVCGPAKPGVAPPEPLGTIRSHRYVAEGGLYTTGAQVIIDGGSLNGLDLGQNLVVRHLFRVRGLEGGDAMGEHSAGLVQIVAVEERSSIAVVVYACDELRTGDFLAAFNPEPIRPPDPRGTPSTSYDDAARILFADEGQILGAPRRLMVIDRGLGQGVRIGQRLTLFRRQRRGGAHPDIVGDAIVVAVRADSATIRIERVNDAISSGDYAAPERQIEVRDSTARPRTR